MHDAQKGIDHLEAEMPAGFEQIRRELLAQQEAEGNAYALKRLVHSSRCWIGATAQ